MSVASITILIREIKMSINNKDWNAVSSLFRPSREVSKNDPTLKIGQIHTCLITGAVSRLYNQRNGKNYWMTGEKVNGKNGRCNTQFRADRNGTIVPTEAVAWGKHVQSMDKDTIRSFITVARDELQGRTAKEIQARNGR